MSVTNALPNLPSIDRGQAAGSNPATPARIKALAAQFESLLVGQMMQQMRAYMFDSDDGDGEKSAAPLADTRKHFAEWVPAGVAVTPVAAA